LAGFVDGEGSFQVIPTKWGYRPTLAISGTHKPSIDRISNMTGKTSTVTYWRNPMWQPAHRITIAAREVLRWVILNIQPYLTTKAEHAPLSLRLLDDKYDETAREGLRILNHRGTAPP